MNHYEKHKKYYTDYRNRNKQYFNNYNKKYYYQKKFLLYDKDKEIFNINNETNNIIVNFD